MGTLLTVWLIVTGCYYLCVVALRVALKLPAVVAYILCLPAMPFIVAYRNREEHPFQAQVIYWGYPVLYALVLQACFLD